MRGWLRPILPDVRRRILLIAEVDAVAGVVVAALVWWPFDQSPSVSPRAKTYGSAAELASDLYRTRGECQQPHKHRLPPPLLPLFVYSCSVAGGRMNFTVFTHAYIETLTALVGEEFVPPVGDIKSMGRFYGRDFARDTDIPGTVVGPNWVAISEWRVTLQAVHQAIGGQLIMVDPISAHTTSLPSPG